MFLSKQFERFDTRTRIKIGNDILAIQKVSFQKDSIKWSPLSKRLARRFTKFCTLQEVENRGRLQSVPEVVRPRRSLEDLLRVSTQSLRGLCLLLDDNEFRRPGERFISSLVIHPSRPSNSVIILSINFEYLRPNNSVPSSLHVFLCSPENFAAIFANETASNLVSFDI